MLGYRRKHRIELYLTGRRPGDAANIPLLGWIRLGESIRVAQYRGLIFL